MLGEGDTSGINGTFCALEKRFSISFSKAKKKFCSSLHYSDDNNYLFVNEKEIYKFKADHKNVNFPTQFCLESIIKVKSEEVSLKANFYDFSVSYSAMDKSDIINIHNYLMVKKNLK